MDKQVIIKGNKQEQKTFTEVYGHYEMATQDLTSRLADWDKKDELFRSYINTKKWPYRSQVFDPRVYTAVLEKTSRLLANRPRGRMVPREGGDVLGAKINNELLNFQWDEVERLDGIPMLARWAMMDMNARKYGAAFALAKWRYETRVKKDEKGNRKKEVWFDGPTFRPLVNRDTLPNPSYPYIKNWFQHRDYVSLAELQRANDAARSKPIYKNLDILRQQIQQQAKSGGDRRDVNWISKNKSIKGLTDFLGNDETYKTIEIVTEYREDRWITFAPKHGIILRDIPNPYDHGQIPVVVLKYYPIDDDIYGLSEIEPVERLQKAVNALICQYLDAINQSLYNILKVRSTGVQMHTLEFGPGNKWLMNDPVTDVVPFQTGNAGVAEFASTYRFMIGAMQEALGETSAAISNLVPGGTEKTATEIKDLAITRTARDNFNQMFLSQAIKRQMMLWHMMNQQFLFSNPNEHYKIVRIVGRDAIRYFQQEGLDQVGLTDEAAKLLASVEGEDLGLQPEQFMQPLYPIETGKGAIPKFQLEPSGEVGYLIMEKADVSGNYDYIPNVESMRVGNDQELLLAKQQAIAQATKPEVVESLARDGYKLNLKDLLVDYYEQLGLKDADKYFERLQGGQNAGQEEQPLQRGVGRPPEGPKGLGNGTNAGLAGGTPAIPGGQGQAFLGGSPEGTQP